MSTKDIQSSVKRKMFYKEMKYICRLELTMIVILVVLKIVTLMLVKNNN